jgi:hypothetical protein
MIPEGKCPNPGCGKVVSHALFEKIRVGDMLGGHAGTIHQGYTVLCPHCKTILGAGFDPYEIQADTIRDTIRGIANIQSGSKKR